MKFIKLEKEAVTPARKSKKSAPYYFVANETVAIQPLQSAFVGTGIRFEDMENDQFLQLSLPDEIALNRPVVIATGVSVYSPDDEDSEIGVVLFNRSVSIAVTIDKGERIAQGILLQYNIVKAKPSIDTKK